MVNTAKPRTAGASIARTGIGSHALLSSAPGDRREPICKYEEDRQRFQETLGKAWDKTGWQVHALFKPTPFTKGLIEPEDYCPFALVKRANIPIVSPDPFLPSSSIQKSFLPISDAMKLLRLYHPIVLFISGGGAFVAHSESSVINPRQVVWSAPTNILVQWQTTGARCVTIGGFFPKETSAEIENEFKDLAVIAVI